MSISGGVLLPSGAYMPLIGLGTYLQSSEQAKISTGTALEIGYRSIDTAEFYANHFGIGESLSTSGITRESIFITDKVSPGGIFGAPPRTRDEIIAICRENLCKMQTSYVDLYLLHHGYCGPSERIKQYDALLELKELGLARDIGVSNFSIKHLEEIKSAGLPLPAVNQIEIHPLCCQSELILYMRKNGIVPVAYSSLAPLTSWRVEVGQDSAKSNAADAFEQELAIINDMALKYNVQPAQLLLKWLIQQGIPVLPKSDQEERLRSNFNLNCFEIENEDIYTLAQMDRNRCFAWPIGNPLECE